MGYERITILGLGNVLMGDEGFGANFARWFSQRYLMPPQVQVVEGGVLGYWLLDIVCSCEKLIVVDVIKTKDEPGSVYRFTKDDMDLYASALVSAHEIQFVDILCKAEMIDEAPNVIFLCVVPQSYEDMRMEMTPTMTERFSVVEGLLLKELACDGVAPQRVTNA